MEIIEWLWGLAALAKEPSSTQSPLRVLQNHLQLQIRGSKTLFWSHLWRIIFKINNGKHMKSTVYHKNSMDWVCKFDSYVMLRYVMLCYHCSWILNIRKLFHIETKTKTNTGFIPFLSFSMEFSLCITSCLWELLQVFVSSWGAPCIPLRGSSQLLSQKERQSQALW